MRFINPAFLLIAILGLTATTASAQETEITVIDEVIAQVNDEVVTLSQIKREMQFAIDSLKNSGKTQAQAEEEVEKKKGQLIANVINEGLMLQKGKEVGFDKTVEAEINKRFRDQMDKNNYKSLDELFKAMEAQGINPDQLRQIWRPQIMREMVWSELVDRPLYFEITDKELKDYFDKNSEKFKKEATVSISEIFLAFAGKDEAAVRLLANQIVKRARNGEDFTKLVELFSDRPDKAQTKGNAGTFNVTELNKQFADPLKNVKVGGLTDPITMDIGMEIIRVDKRTEGSDESTFNENAVRQAIWKKKMPEARIKFMKKLKEDAFIKIRENYRPIVTPFLNADLTAESTTASK